MTAVSPKKAIFGVHSITPYSLNNGMPLSKQPLNVVGTFSASLTQEQVELQGGSNFDSWDVELGARTFEGSLLLREYPSVLYEIATGKKPTENAAESGGSVSALKNIKGVSG
jgi:hypothetical protein